MPKPPADEKPTLLLVPLSREDLELVAAYAKGNGLQLEAGAAKIIAEWAGRQRVRNEARRRGR